MPGTESPYCPIGVHAATNDLLISGVGPGPLGRERAASIATRTLAAGISAMRDAWAAGMEAKPPPRPESDGEWFAHCAFYRLTMQQRDRAWRELNDLRHELDIREGQPSREELANRLAAIQQHITALGRDLDALEPDKDRLDDATGVLSIIDHALRGDPGHTDPDAWDRQRRDARARYGGYLGIPRA